MFKGGNRNNIGTTGPICYLCCMVYVTVSADILDVGIMCFKLALRLYLVGSTVFTNSCLEFCLV